MGGKSGGDQVAGYRYFTNLVLMIGNRIEELKAINFDKRGWIINDEQKLDPRAKMEVDATFNFTNSDIYGKDEGGIVGAIGLRLGKPSPEADPTYAAYLQSKDFPALAYPYLSYLVFKGKNEEGFYVGNNPFLKEMMLWPKRIHVRNDGREQWHDEKAEIGNISIFRSSSNEFKNFSFEMTGFVYYQLDAGPGYPPNPITMNSWGSGKFPFYDAQQSYQYSDEPTIIPVDPSLEATAYIFENNDLPLEPGAGTELPPTKFEKFPVEGDRGTTIARSFGFSGNFFWMGGMFSGKTLLSANNAAITIERQNKDGTYTVAFIRSGPPHEFTNYELSDFNINLEKGMYRVTFNSGIHYLLLSTPRPYGGMWVYAKNETEDVLNDGDINPIHKIREILTDDTAMNISELELNDEVFTRAADQIWDEGLGISAVFTEKNCKEALDEICAHIEAGVRVNRQTGKYEVILFRDNWYDLDNALHFDQSNIKRGSFSVEVMNTDDAINVLNVNYYDRDNIKDSSFNVYENGLIQTMGRENAETVDFPYFMNQRNAEVVANWKLKQLSTPAWRGSFSTSHRAARKLNRYDIITVTWPSKQIYDMPMRVMKINLGTATDTAVTIDFVEVVPYSNELISSIVVDPPVSVVLPPQQTNTSAFEVPYYALVQSLGQREADARLTYNPELGYLGVSAQKPQSNSLNALLYTDGGTGDYSQFERVGVVDYNKGVYLDQTISQLDTSFAVAELDYVRNGAPKFSSVDVGTIGQIGDELISFVNYDSEMKILTVKRGILDTIPKKHIDGLIHFWGDSFAYDSTEYVMGETVGAQVLTTTPSAVYLLQPSAVKEVEMNARAIRPYPPANVKINAEFEPIAEIVDDMLVTWSDRNRLQQTGGNPIGWFEDGVLAEDGVTYGYDLFDTDSNALISHVDAVNSPLIIPKSTMSLNNRLELFSVKNNFRSFQSYIYNFVKSATNPWLPSLINPVVWIDANSQEVNLNNQTEIATDLSSNKFDLITTPVGIGYDSQRKVKYFSSTQNGYTSLAAAQLFNGKSKAWVFIVLSAPTSIESYFFSIGKRRFELGAFNSVVAGYILGAHQQESNGWLNVFSTVQRPINTWHMLLVEVDLEKGFIIHKNGVLQENSNQTSSRIVFSDPGGMPLSILNTSGNEIKCTAMLTGFSDISLDREKLFGWAAHKYGLNDLLPESHPYKTSPPMV